MASRIRISYQWRLFIPMVAGLWIVIFAMAAWQYKHNRDFREARIYEQLDFINARVVDSYDNSPRLLPPFLDFVYEYYRQNSVYDRIQISIYENGRLVRSQGAPVLLTPEEIAEVSGVRREISPGYDENGSATDEYFYYRVMPNSDGTMLVATVLPFDHDVNAAIMPSMKVFVMIFLMAMVLTILTFFATRHFGKNIRILRSVAEKAVTDQNFLPMMDFPHDEFGDINRQIVHMYNERSQAMQRQKREHMIAMHAIEEKARAKRQMSSNINHELRTPIGVIKGYLDTLLENPEMDVDTRTHFLRKAQEHAQRLVSLISDVSAITRLEEGGELINTEELDFHDIAYTLANDIEESGVLGTMKFEYSVPLDCKIMGNYNLLTGMLMNLARNAAAYSQGTLCELIMLEETDKFYKFVFRDNGRGVGEEHLPHLFERFYRVDSGRARKAGGTGLGLPIVQSTVNAHGGTITVSNRKSGGLAFYFTLHKSATGKGRQK
ncbi:MAG: HAMP domain-containing histidine kinase [Muribaculaceae bacterium]|nr:HAMP domain-containing histidine kinase [Muribaculaceae bacterium]